MSNFLAWLVSTDGFVPRAECGAWTRNLILVHNVSDFLIWTAYLAIPLVLVALLLAGGQKVPFRGVVWLFVLFIVSCGFTHFLEIIIFYHPLYPLSGVLKIITAIASWGTVLALVKVVPGFHSAPSGGGETASAISGRGRDQLDVAMSQRVNAGFVGVLLLMSIIAFVSVHSARRITEAARDAAQSNRTLRWLEGLSTDLARAESASRGYLTTGTANYADDYREATKDAARKLADIGAMVATSTPAEASLFHALELTTNAKVAWMATATEMTRKRGGGAPSAVMSGEGRASTAAFAAAMNALQSYEEDQLTLHEAKIQASMSTTTVVTLGGMVITLGFLGLAGILVNRQIGQSARARADLRALNQELEARVAARTAELDVNYAELTASEQRLQTVTESLREGLVISTREGRILHWNRAGLEMHGYRTLAEGLRSLPDFADTFVLTDLAGNVLPLAQWPLARMMAGEQLRDFHVRLSRRDRDWRRVFSFSGGMVSMASGEALIYLAIEDITLRQQAEEQIRELNADLERRVRERTAELAIAKERAEAADRLKSEFLATMSHELRTPLNGIIGFSEFLIDGSPGAVNEKQREYLGDILDSGEHLLTLINDILDLSKIEAGMMELHPMPFSIRAALDEVTSITTPLAQKKNVTLECRVDAGLDEITLDRQKFKQIFYNLVSNALKFSHPGGVVRVAITPAGPESIQLQVVDEGIGIREQDHDKLFTAFRQLDSGLARQQQGTGLGLALTKRIVELQGGRIGFESEFGRGTTFTVRLPRPPAAKVNS